ncbi:MAG: substrate-binding domain-containing protein [Atopostipes suicloacalis]|nr:substrate-binding domain-containing protein [Atopostipes suicloacalis]MDN6731019.1 substrate-binding domain-containing protein [Atopostipes suicloacalis]
MAKQTVTIYDVARESGVSMATVSRVVNHNPNVKPSTRQKVEEVIKRLKYRPNAVARGLASKKTTTVGVIIPDVTNLYFSSLAKGIDDIASMYNYNIILASSDGDTEKEIRVLNTVLAQQVDGIIFMGNKLKDQVRKEIELTDTPVVLAGTLDEEGKLPTIGINYKTATKDATKFLLEKGYEKIALLGLDMHSRKHTMTTEGYQEAMGDFDEHIIRVDENLANFEADRVIDKFIEDEINAAVIEDDRLAIDILNHLFARGLNVPNDFEIITLNNSPLVKISRPNLTTVSQPLYDIGAVAMRLLTKLMNDEEIDEFNISLPYKIRDAGSTK